MVVGLPARDAGTTEHGGHTAHPPSLARAKPPWRGLHFLCWAQVASRNLSVTERPEFPATNLSLHIMTHWGAMAEICHLRLQIKLLSKISTGRRERGRAFIVVAFV